MSSDLEQPLIVPLVRALTRAPTLMGVPYMYFMMNGVATAVIFLASHNLAMLLAGGDQGLAERLADGIDHAFAAGETRRGMKNQAHRSIVPTRRIFRCSCITPYSRASAVGGQPGT